MAMQRLFQLSVALAIFCLVPAAPVSAARGGGGGGGGMLGGGAGFSGGGAARASYGGSYGAATGAARATTAPAARSAYTPNTGGTFARTASPNSSAYVRQQGVQSTYHYNGGDGRGRDNWDNSYRGPYWGVGWGAGWYLGYPWFPYWGGYPFGWNGYWGDYFYPYGPVYATGYPLVAGGYPYPEDGQYATNFGVAPGPAAAGVGPQLPAEVPQVAANNGEAGNEGLEYYNEARTAFLQGDYHNALRLAGHSGLEAPQNPKVHELTSLALFATDEYKAAAIEAHFALAYGPPSDWPSLYSYYNDADKYTVQLRKLEKAVTDSPESAPGQFLLAYHYLMTGAKAEAKTHFAKAAKLAPNDKLAQHILDQLESNSPVTPPKLPPPPNDQKGKLL
jgi:hypothetical protein